MPLSFSGNVDRGTLLRASEAVVPLVDHAGPAGAWEQESALPGMTVGGLTRHLVSQPECAVEFLRIQPPPPHAEVVSLAELYRRTDWFTAPVDAPENTSIRDDVNAMGTAGWAESREVLHRAVAELPGALAGAGPTTYVPWQDCAVATEDFVVVRLMEIVVHAHDLAVGLGVPPPDFDEDVVDPVLALLGVLAGRQHGTADAVSALARAERAAAPAAAFGPRQRPTA